MPFLGKTPTKLLDANVNIDGGTIDGTTIGATSAAAGTFTNLTATGTLTLPDDGISGDDVNGGTISNFASTGIDDNATSTAITIDSSQKVGIGTTSPAFGLSVESDNGSGYAALFRKSSSDPALTIQTTSSITQIQGLNSALNATNNIAMQLSGGNVGIGTASPDAPLHIQTASGSKSEINLAQTAVTNYRISIPASTDALTFVYGASTERMRIDSSGRLLIGKTAVNNSTAGFMFESGSTGYAAFTNTGTASSHRVILCNRESGDGSLIDLQRAGSLKGNIGINGGDEPYFARNVGTTSGIKIANGALTACQSDGTNHDNAQDLGSSSIRWRNLHMAGDAVMGASSNIIYESGTTFNVRAAVANLTFQTNGANERMRIDANGRLATGTTAPANPVEFHYANRAQRSFNGIFDTATADITKNLLTLSNFGFNVTVGIQVKLHATCAISNEYAIIEFFATAHRASGGTVVYNTTTPTITSPLGTTNIFAGTASWSGATLRYTTSTTVSYVGYASDIFVSARDAVFTTFH